MGLVENNRPLSLIKRLNNTYSSLINLQNDKPLERIRPKEEASKTEIKM